MVAHAIALPVRFTDQSQEKNMPNAKKKVPPVAIEESISRDESDYIDIIDGAWLVSTEDNDCGREVAA